MLILLRIFDAVPFVRRASFRICSMTVDIVCRDVATSWARVDPSSRTWHGVPTRYPLVRCLSKPSEVSKCFPQASHTVPSARLTLLGAGSSAMIVTMTSREQRTTSRKTNK